jgi:hypothetical protein
MLGSSNCAENDIARLIHFVFNEAECLGKQQLKHCTFWKKKRDELPVGIVGCRWYNSYIYTECIGNNSRGGGGRDGSQVLVNPIQTLLYIYIYRERERERDSISKTEGGGNGRPQVQLQAGTKYCSLPATLFLLRWLYSMKWDGNMIMNGEYVRITKEAVVIYLKMLQNLRKPKQKSQLG